MNIALWVAQILLGFMFVMAGSMKTFNHKKVKETMSWAKNGSTGYILFVGLSELLGGLGLLLPGALDIAPVLTGIAAIGIAIIMVLAIAFHAKQKETQAIGMNVVLLLLALFIAVGRLGIEPF
ncbi:DoxX family protein [Paenibacillus harenae]|uniref:Membrane protein YphA (DoxX/SURF4 family) n=1 Tax=Paenibacillus harenae TaxID=306543 RepID=A0ABT9U6L0_PAEHA|nr:DoxX family protein [Paenibacillus harenae]MDQ0060658.1 putative membrane protein YphA (DoxX/SURF4 family) [Paenibacillus harenae]MDQ0115277.1 putative membrane protein YphA (DoxX/SURF4 family) [Paenibacillus harenae]